VTEEGWLVPTALVAVTLNEYFWLDLRPFTVHDSAPVVEHDLLPGFEVTMYRVIVEAPSSAGASHLTVNWPRPTTTRTFVGTPGTVGGRSVKSNTMA
jgi:hypothetical protein